MRERLLLLILLPLISGAVFSQVFQSGNRYLKIQILDDDLVHFEISESRSPVNGPIWSTPMVEKKDYSGPSTITTSQNVLKTSLLQLTIDLGSLNVACDQFNGTEWTYLTTFSYANLNQALKSLQFDKGWVTDVYGLGQIFTGSGQYPTEGNWMNSRIMLPPGDTFGNFMTCTDELGCSGWTQFPVMYAAGPGSQNYAVFVDNVYRHEWFFDINPMAVTMWGDNVRWYLMQGKDLPDLRHDYMELVGKPLIPPMSLFGYWQSTFGYDDWAEVNRIVDRLRNFSFPIDGVCFDLQWFGGRFYDTNDNGITIDDRKNSAFGKLRWDPINFPNPAQNVQKLAEKGVGIMVIEEPYIAERSDTYTLLSSIPNGMARYCADSGCSSSGPISSLTSNPWWGIGGMIDYSSEKASSLFFDCKRCRLIKGCVVNQTLCSNTESTEATEITAFWTDLGEPEMFEANQYYAGYQEDFADGRYMHSEGDNHNIFNFLWTKSIHDGYVRNNIPSRNWVLSRSGASGSQRYGAALWSGDIGATFTMMAQHYGAQKHMALVGIDYYGSDVGGFHRSRCGWGCDVNDLYKQWVANAAWLDLPFRPHVWDTSNTVPATPDIMGDLKSNLFNIRQRYSLTPFYYSLSFAAWSKGEPIVPPLFYYYQEDMTTRSSGGMKMIGRDIIVGITASQGQTERNVYLPKGRWAHFITNDIVLSTGQWFPATQLFEIPGYCNPGQRCIFTIPAYYREGAILPMKTVTADTLNVFFETKSKTVDNSLTFRVFVGSGRNEFTMYEDDGKNRDYLNGIYRTTLISTEGSGNSVTCTIAATSGTYPGSVGSRNMEVRALFAIASSVSRVTLNGNALTNFPNLAAYNAATSGYYIVKNGEIWAKSGEMAVTSQRQFVFLTTKRIDVLLDDELANSTDTNPFFETSGVGAFTVIVSMFVSLLFF
eukprot:TRINITY_DN2711_c0_g1_i2.p1 TRINITY_DN2711_c0_g1~~TRINITY_DN2711_c0_g1_i2.p1  ORF type:complete len:942 (-),score=232.52 TRINITY_DN2711_c0_g1_i2:36-2837(-)